MTKQFVIGKTYKYAKGCPDDHHVEFTNADGTFICHDVTGDDLVTHCWSMDSTCSGDSMRDGQGWCVANDEQLNDGDVIEV